MTQSNAPAFFMIVLYVTLDDPYPDTGESGETYDAEMAKRPLGHLVPIPSASTEANEEALVKG